VRYEQRRMQLLELLLEISKLLPDVAYLRAQRG
jgi:hypothetical protein